MITSSHLVSIAQQIAPIHRWKKSPYDGISISRDVDHTPESADVPSDSLLRPTKLHQDCSTSWSCVWRSLHLTVIQAAMPSSRKYGFRSHLYSRVISTPTTKATIRYMNPFVLNVTSSRRSSHFITCYPLNCSTISSKSGI